MTVAAAVRRYNEAQQRVARESQAGECSREARRALADTMVDVAVAMLEEVLAADDPGAARGRLPDPPV